MNDTTSHITWIDTLKGIAIILVVIGHAIAWNFTDFGELIEYGPKKDLLWFHFIYSFHMPLFFWISGYLLPRKDASFKALQSVIWRRFYTLIIPLLTSGSILYFLSMGGAIIWFLKALFEFILIAYIYEYFRYRYSFGIIQDVLFIFLLYFLMRIAYKYVDGTQLNNILSMEYLLFGNYIGFFAGILCKRYKILMEKMNTNVMFTLCFVLFVIVFSVYLYFPDIPIIVRVKSWLLPVCGIICMIYLVKNRIDQMGVITKCVNYLGQHSLEIYILQDFFVFRLLNLGEYEISMVHSVFYMDVFWGHTCMLLSSILIAALMISLCLITMFVIRSSNVLSIILLGRKN